MVNNFDPIARAYDELSFLVFGDQLSRIRHHFLPAIKADSRVLIVGGGTGSCLEAFVKGVRIDFVEKSERMLTRAMRRQTACEVTFVQSDFHDWKPEKDYDFVLLPFFLDCFGQDQMPQILDTIRGLMAPAGALVVTDFYDTGRWYHRGLLWSMHQFFRVVARLEARKLPDLPKVLDAEGWELQARHSTQNGFIFSAVYQLGNK